MEKVKDFFQNLKFGYRQKVTLIIAGIVIAISAVIIFVLLHYRVTNVEVIGNSHYTRDEIIEMVMPSGRYDNSILLSIKYRNKSIKDIPFIESMDVEVVSHDSIKIQVYEKSLAGCVMYLGNYMYFDREGIVVESSTQPTEGVAEITGLHFESVRLYEVLPVEKPEVFQEILDLSQLMDKYNISADKIFFDTEMRVTLYFGDARVKLGDSSNIDEKIMQLSVMLPAIRGKSGQLDMSDFSSSTTTLTFEPD